MPLNFSQKNLERKETAGSSVTLILLSEEPLIVREVSSNPQQISSESWPGPKFEHFFEALFFLTIARGEIFLVKKGLKD